MLNKIGPKKLTQKLTNGVITSQKWGHVEIVPYSGGLLSSGGSPFYSLYVLIPFKSGILEPLYFWDFRNKIVFISLLVPKKSRQLIRTNINLNYL